MNSVWGFLSIFLDVYPWLFLQYLPFRRCLRLSYGRTIALCSAVLLAWQLGLLWFSAQPFYSPDGMLAYRFAQLLILTALSCIMIRGPISRALFVFCLMFPWVMLVMAAACFLGNFIPLSGYPPYCVTSLGRLALSAALLPFILRLFRRVLIPAMEVQEEGVWRYAWLIPASFTLVSAAYTKNDFETAGVSLSELLGRIFLFGGVLASCLLLFRMIGQAEQRIRADEEAKKSKLLLELEAKQYRALTDSIQQARQTRHDLRQHMSLLSAMARQGDWAELQGYLSRFGESAPADGSVAYCENPAVNALLRHYLAQAKAAGIAVTTEMELPAQMGIEVTDLAILLGNLLENALEACTCLPPAGRWMELKGRMQGSRLFLILSNTCGPEAECSAGGTLSRKRGYSETGLGLLSVRAVVSKYDGESRVKQEQGRFTVSVMLREKSE